MTVDVRSCVPCNADFRMIVAAEFTAVTTSDVRSVPFRISSFDTGQVADRHVHVLEDRTEKSAQ